MRRAKVLGATLAAIGTIAIAVPAEAQEVGADLGLFSSYVWRGLSLTNKPVAEPDLYVSFPAGKASVTVGGWANIDLGKYDDLDRRHQRERGPVRVQLRRVRSLRRDRLSGGQGDADGRGDGVHLSEQGRLLDVRDHAGLLTSGVNTVEIYGKLEVDAPLSPALSIYYDVDKIKGAYIEGSISHSLVLSEKVGLDLGALAGFSAGQGINDDPNSDESIQLRRRRLHAPRSLRRIADHRRRRVHHPGAASGDQRG